ncbi:helix-turn-helix domain-containing protein [Burkholderia glumae]|uniref:helix-turn-helix domain-containing protein n=1 Tax=Burkholderia glumae TaxID=337 RepID=UPI0035902031
MRGRSRALSAKIQRAERLASSGMSIGQIAKVLGCSTATIRSWRARGQAQRLSQILSYQSQSKIVCSLSNRARFTAAPRSALQERLPACPCNAFHRRHPNIKR